MFDGLAPCAVYGLLNDLGYMVSCESDMHCAMTMALLKSATLGENKLLDGPYIHYFVEIEGDFRREIAEFCKYFPPLHVDKI